MSENHEKKPINDELEIEPETDNKTYEIGYLLSPLIPAEGLDEATNKYLKQVISAVNAEVVGDWPARKLSLSYPIRKLIENKRVTFRDSYFGALRFRGQPAAAVKLATTFRQTPELIRFLLLEISQAALAQEKHLQNRQKRTDEASTSEAVANPPDKPVMSTDEMDKEIEQLLTTGTYVSK